LKELSKIVSNLNDESIDDRKEAILYSLIIPNFVGSIQLVEGILEDKVKLKIEKGVVINLLC